MSNRRPGRFVRLSPLAAFLFLLPIVGSSVQAQTEPPPCERIGDFEAEDFPSAPTVDNQWLPLIPGTQVVLEGEADRGGGALPHRVVFTATNLTKVIGGVRSRVMWDLDINEGRLSEAELAFFAQDLDGNVWNLGEYPEEYEEETFIGAPSTWIQGLAGAEGGVHMLGEPEVSDLEYLQGWVPDIEFLDCATVVSMTETTCVPVACYDPVLLTHERSPLDPEGGIQTKFHAQGVGIVQIGAIDDPEGETLILVQRQQLGPNAMALVNREALRLDKRAYRVSEVYADTPPIEPPRSGPQAQRASERARWGKGLHGGKASWCVRALGPKLCRKWSRGSLIRGAGTSTHRG